MLSPWLTVSERSIPLAAAPMLFRMNRSHSVMAFGAGGGEPCVWGILRGCHAGGLGGEVVLMHVSLIPCGWIGWRLKWHGERLGCFFASRHEGAKGGMGRINPQMDPDGRRFTPPRHSRLMGSAGEEGKSGGWSKCILGRLCMSVRDAHFP